MFHQQLILLREIFQKNGYTENFIDRCFKLCLNRIHILKEKVTAIEKTPPRLVFPYLEIISLQTRTKLQKSIKGILNCCKLQVIFESQNKLALKTMFPKFLHQVQFASVSMYYV